MYDFLIVGAGFYGATIARLLTDAGKSVIVLESRAKVGGNASDSWHEDFLIQDHGGHIFHTNDGEIWRFVNQFGKFWNYRHEVIVDNYGKKYSFPFSLRTLKEVEGSTGKGGKYGRDLESWAISQMGKQAYNIFVKHFTEKQWGVSATKLPSSILRRIHFRNTYYTGYFLDEFQGMPEQGYTRLIENMLGGIEVRFNEKVHQNHPLTGLRPTICTAPIDEFYGYRFGKLPYRSLRFETLTELGTENLQGIATINHTGATPNYTKTHEWRHYMKNPPRGKSAITFEYPQVWKEGRERYYPIKSQESTELFQRYSNLAAEQGILFGGRLGRYQYIDMHQAIGMAMKDAGKILDGTLSL